MENFAAENVLKRGTRRADPIVDRPFSQKCAILPGLQEVLDMAVRLIAPRWIFLSGTYKKREPAKPVYDLLIVLPNHIERPHREYTLLAEHISARIHPIMTTFIKSADLCKKLNIGHIFFSLVCRPENLLYTTNSPLLPGRGALPVKAIILRAKRDFLIRMSRATSFMKGARFFQENRDKELTAFMLQQAVELACRAIITGLTGQQLHSHSLRALLLQCQRCVPELGHLFMIDREEDERLLTLLKQAYVGARYKDHYIVEETDLQCLLHRTARLHAAAEALFYQKIQEKEQALNQL